MSVINQMLRDLDARAASDQERAGLPPRIRTLPPGGQVRRQNLRMLVIGMGAGALLMAGVLLLFRAFSSPDAPPAIPPPPAAPVLPAAVPPAPTFTAPAVPATSAVPADVAEMKLSMLVGQTQTKPPTAAVAASSPPPLPPLPAPPAPPKTLPAMKPVTAPPAAAAKPAPVAASSPAPAPQAVAEESQIDKRSKGGHGREFAEAEYRKAMQAVKRGDNEAALPLFKRALELDPDLARARQGYLSVLVAAKRWDMARQVAEQGLALDPTQSGWANIVARLQFEQGDTAGAVQTLERFAVHAPHDADYQGLFAYLLQKQQRPAEAAERFRAALQVRPNEGRWWFGLGLSLEQAGNAGGAKEAYAKARSLGNLPPDMVLAVEQKLK